MHADTFLIAILAALAAVALPLGAWLRAQKRIRDLEMTLLTQATDADRYDELRALLQQVISQTDHLADQHATLARRAHDVGRILNPPPIPEVPEPLLAHASGDPALMPWAPQSKDLDLTVASFRLSQPRENE